MSMSLPPFYEMAPVEDILRFFFKLFSIEIFFTIVIKGILNDNRKNLQFRILRFLHDFFRPYFFRAVSGS